jgi:type I restriction enzyme S subunit
VSDLPEGWTRARLPEVADLTMGQSPPSSSYNASEVGLPFFQGKAEFGEIYPTPVKYCSAPQKIAEKADILISVRAPVGPTNICKEKSCIGRGLAAIRPRAGVNGRYVFYFLRSIEQWVARQGTGSTFTAISKSDLERIEVPLPPLNEQRRILAMLEESLGKVNACQKRLAKIPVILKRFRQSVLAAGCSGRLTADWREKEEDPEPTRELLFEPDGAGDIPSSWAWKKLSDLTQVKGGVTKGRNFQGRKTILLPYLRVANVQDGYLDLREIKQIEVLPGDAQKYSLNDGDVLFTEGGDRDKLGRGTIWRGEIANCIHQNHIFRARLTTTSATAEYLSLASKSEFSRQYFFANASQTVNLASINLTMLSGLPLPLPPLKEQMEIVTRVDSLFEFVDQIDTRYRNARAQVDKLTQSILAKAFRGELVSTEAELARREGRYCEPASILLERIREAREGHSRKPRINSST